MGNRALIAFKQKESVKKKEDVPVYIFIGMVGEIQSKLSLMQLKDLALENMTQVMRWLG